MATAVLQSFEQMVERSGKIAAMNAYFGVYGSLPEEKFPGEYHEALGDKDLGEDVETWIRNNCPR